MYESPRRRVGYGAAGPHARQIAVNVHEGTRHDYLRRHERDASDAARRSLGERRSYATCLDRRACDTRMLMCAIDELVAAGPRAPGPNGLELTTVPRHLHGQIARSLSSALKGGVYESGPVRRLKIPKSSGIGTRTLEIGNAENRVVQRAILNALQPFIDPQLDIMSLGFRPGRSREQALAIASDTATSQGRWAWVADDVRDAFDHVPRERCYQVLRQMGLTSETTGLLDAALGRGARRGIPQGGALSPLLLNVYLGHFVDRPWRRRHPDVPLLRVADDLLALCRSKQEAERALQTLRELTANAAMKLKGESDTTIRRLDRQETTRWLGYSLYCSLGNELLVRIDERSWRRLANSLALSHLEPWTPLRMHEAIRGWIQQFGPCYAHMDRDAVMARIANLSRQYGLEETPDDSELRAIWEDAHRRFLSLREVRGWRTSVEAGIACGSAHMHLTRPPRPQPPAPACQASRGAASQADVGLRVYVHATPCDSSRGGGWAYLFDSAPYGQRAWVAGAGSHFPQSDRELLAATAALEAIEDPHRVVIVTSSHRLADLLAQDGPRWLREHRRDIGSRVEVVRSLFRARARHRVTVTLLASDEPPEPRGHADALIRDALEPPFPVA